MHRSLLAVWALWWLHNAILQCVTVHRLPKFTSCHNAIMVVTGRAHCSILLYIFITINLLSCFVFIYIVFSSFPLCIFVCLICACHHCPLSQILIEIVKLADGCRPLRYIGQLVPKTVTLFNKCFISESKKYIHFYPQLYIQSINNACTIFVNIFFGTK